MIASFVDSQRKREREDDLPSVSDGPGGFSEHRHKRLQCLPLRSSPSKRLAETRSFSVPSLFAQSQLPSPTPVTAAAVSAYEPPSLEQFSEEPELTCYNSSQWTPDSPEVDMMDTTESQEPPAGLVDSNSNSNQQLQPGPSQPDHQGQAPGTISGRMPTPIHCTFAQQVKGNNWTGPGVPDDHAHTAVTVLPSTPPGQSLLTAALDSSSVPRSFEHSAEDWSIVQNRRLPSPISESGCSDIMSSPESPSMVLDSSSSPSSSSHRYMMQTPNTSHLSQLTHDHPMLSALPRALSSSPVAVAADHNPEWSSSPAQGADSPWSGTGTGTQRRGHVRSKHTLNSWTALEPGMKRSFSIGYRADCEKCRMRVPGHFNHIILS